MRFGDSFLAFSLLFCARNTPFGLPLAGLIFSSSRATTARIAASFAFRRKSMVQSLRSMGVTTTIRSLISSFHAPLWEGKSQRVEWEETRVWAIKEMVKVAGRGKHMLRHTLSIWLSNK